jgi:hypothetical protein
LVLTTIVLQQAEITQLIFGRPLRRLAAILAIFAAAASGGGTARAGSSVANEERLLAQEGFSVALAGTVLVSQTYIIT